MSDQEQGKVTTTILAQHASNSLIPEFIHNIIKSANSASRVVLKVCEGTESVVEGIDRLATASLKAQHKKLMDLAAA